MPYITIPKSPKKYQITFDDILNGVNLSALEAMDLKNTYDTITLWRENLSPQLLQNVDIAEMINCLKAFNIKYENLIKTQNKATLYRSFKIPKRSGGLRQIDAPNDELMAALRELKYIFELKLYANYHTSAFAYIKGRSTIDAVKRHQKNNSKWFLKLDFHNFFGSSSPEFVISQLRTIFPFSEILSRKDGEQALTTCLSLCFLNGGLPQGTPISPTLTNLFMIPIDYRIAQMARSSTSHLVYTRYADDIILSSNYSFKWSDIQQNILNILKEFAAPFSLNVSKTRYASSAGRNWNLGVMLNKDNQITIGHARKKVFKAMLFAFMADDKNGKPWSLEDAQHLSGLISYYKMVEEAPINEIIKSYGVKFNKDVEQTLKAILTQRLNSSGV